MYVTINDQLHMLRNTIYKKVLLWWQIFQEYLEHLNTATMEQNKNYKDNNFYKDTIYRSEGTLNN